MIALPFSRKPVKPRAFLNEAGLYDYAVKSLGRQMRTEADLRRLMQSRVEPGERGEAVIASVVAQLKERRYLDDQSFAETYARIRKPENPKETARVMRRLVTAGFSTAVIYKILRQWDVPEEALSALDNLNEEPHEE